MRDKLQITRQGNYFNISIGVGKLFKAYDLTQIKSAVEHYFRFEMTTGHFGNKNSNCPLCFNKQVAIQNPTK